MARTFIRQDTQVRNSDAYTDSLTAGVTLQTGAANIEDDLNALRSQAKRAIFADSAGNWYADIPTVNGKKRAISALNTDLDDIEEKRLLFWVIKLSDIAVPATQNWVILNVGGGEAPSEVRASGATTLGAVCATSAFSGAGFAANELVEISGPNAISPKNLVLVVDSTTGQVIQSSGRDVFGLLQAESSGTDGTAFNDTSGGNRVKISFVRPTAARDDLEACPVADIQGKTINYQYVRRINFDAVPETAFLQGAFVDMPGASQAVTLQNAIDNQATFVTQTNDQDIRIADANYWQFSDSTGARQLLKIDPAVGNDTVSFDVDTFDVNNVNDADFLNGAIFDSGGTPIRVGVTAGYIDTAAADLGIRAGGELYLDDSNQTGSTWAQTAGIKLSDTTAEWDAFETAFGEVSLLRAIAQSRRRDKVYANVTATTNADTDVGGVGGGTNLDAQLPDMSIGNFLADYDVFLNGELLRPGANSGANHDYYPGTSLANGQLRFEFRVKLNDVLCVIPYTRY